MIPVLSFPGIKPGIKKIFFTGAVFFLFTTATAFPQFPDSLQRALNSALHDTSRAKVLVDYSRIEFELSDSLFRIYSEAALEIINRNPGSSFKNKFYGYKADVLTRMGDYYLSMKGEQDSAMKVLDEASAIARSLNDNQRSAAILTVLCTNYLMTADIDKLKPGLDSCMHLQQEANDQKGLVRTYHMYGNYYTLVGNNDSALVLFKKGYSLAVELKDKIAESNMLLAMGINQIRAGKLHEALEYFYNSVKAVEDAGNPDEAYTALFHIGYIYSQLEEHEKALDFFHRAEVITRKIHDIAQLCEIYRNMSVPFKQLHQVDSAIYYLEKSLVLARKINSVQSVNYGLINIATSYLELKDTSRALRYLWQCRSENKGSEVKGSLMECFIELASVYLSLQKTDSAYYYAALLINNPPRKNETLTLQKKYYNLLSKIYDYKGDYKNSFESYKSYIKLRDSIDMKKVFRDALTRQYEYESEKKELLAKTERDKKDFEIKEQKNKRILSTVAFTAILALGGSLVFVNRKRKENMFRKNLAESEMKALRAQMNPHFMFNSLNAIQQMVLNNENDNAFHYLDTYSKLTRKILENSEKKWITVEEEIKFLELYLSIESLRFQHSFIYEIRVDDDVSVHIDKVPAVVVQPYVENAIRHGLLPKQGDQKLLISFNKADDDTLEIIIEDNGVGRKHSGELKTNSDHQSMGMTITENRLRLLEGKKGNKVFIEDLVSEIDGSPAGTCVHIIIRQEEA
jgi:tetratricopeptide (TPR) repeat protein